MSAWKRRVLFSLAIVVTAAAGWYIVPVIAKIDVEHSAHMKRQWAAAEEERKIVWKGECPVVDLKGDSLVGDCPGEMVYVRDKYVLYSYLLNPGPLTCHRQKNGWYPGCDPRPFKPAP